MRFFLFPVCMLLCLGTLTARQRELRGIVLDGQDLSALQGVKVNIYPEKLTDSTNRNGLFRIVAGGGTIRVVFSYPGYLAQEITLDSIPPFLKIFLQIDNEHNEAIVVKNKRAFANTINPNFGNVLMPVSVNHAETYDRIIEHKFVSTSEDPLSTFALSVDRASYSNVRRFLDTKQRVPPEAVRIEELINYFHYHYPLPTAEAPLSVSSMVTDCPWNEEHRLLRIAVQAKSLQLDSLPANNLVFLLDVSGSMDYPNKLPLLQVAFRLLVNNLRPQDRVAIVVYAGAAGLALPSTSCVEKQKILDALDHLNAGGSTAGGEGIKLAYKIARENYIPDGNNRVILATDGDFNLGQTGDEDMRQLILQEQGTGIYLTCLGVGMDNYKDSKLETLARWGHGNFAYIDHPEEAEKVFGKEFVNTLFTVARNARIHLLFNPVKVKSYRLIGYENRLLPMDDDSTAFELMGGDIGAGSCVTAFYELESAGGKEADSALFSHSNELAELSLQYELADDGAHEQLRQLVPDHPLPFARADADYRFAASVGLWGMLLRNSHYAGSGTLGEVESIARHALGEDAEGYRRQFLKLIKEQQKAERKKKRK